MPKLSFVSFAFTTRYTSYNRTTCLLTPLLRVGNAQAELVQLHWMERYLETGQARNISKLFIKIARLRADAPDRYAALLRRAKEELEELGIR